METILIDLGNSALKWADLNNPELPTTFVHESSGLLDQSVKKEWERRNIRRVYGCNVASDYLAHSVESFFKSLGIDCCWFKSEKIFRGEFEIENAYEHYYLLGADRWMAALGAVSLHRDVPLLVCHLGTASTIDSVVPTGTNQYKFLGGRIAPGPAMMREGLARGTSHLPRAFGKRMNFPDNTVDAITTGIIDSQLGLIERAVREMHKIGCTPKILLAGGAAKLIAPYVLEEFESVDVRHNLVLHGLATMAIKYEKSSS